MDFLQYFERFEQTIEIEQAKFFLTMLCSMLPVVELRGGIPFGTALGLTMRQACLAAIVGNMLPIPFLIRFTRRVFAWLKGHIPALQGMISRLEQKAAGQRGLVDRYKFWGLLILVAVPLPGTGAWTGALVAACMGMKLRQALPAIFVGVLIAGGLVSAVTLGLIAI